MEKVKRGINVLIQLLINFVSCHEHRPFFSIPFATHDLTRSDLICIDPFSEDSDNVSFQVSNTLDSPSHVLPPFPLHYAQHVRASSFAGIDTLFSETPDAPFLLWSPKLRLRLYIHLYVNPHEFVSPQSHQILLILVILHPLLLF